MYAWSPVFLCILKCFFYTWLVTWDLNKAPLRCSSCWFPGVSPKFLQKYMRYKTRTFSTSPHKTMSCVPFPISQYTLFIPLGHLVQNTVQSGPWYLCTCIPIPHQAVSTQRARCCSSGSDSKFWEDLRRQPVQITHLKFSGSPQYTSKQNSLWWGTTHYPQWLFPFREKCSS